MTCDPSGNPCCIDCAWGCPVKPSEPLVELIREVRADTPVPPETNMDALSILDELDDIYDSLFGQKVLAICDAIAEMLVTKNMAYGDSALNPVRIFSNSDTDEQLLVRIDDKLSRIARGHEYQSEDVIDDLIGYLIMLKIKRMEDSDE